MEGSARLKQSTPPSTPYSRATKAARPPSPKEKCGKRKRSPSPQRAGVVRRPGIRYKYKGMKTEPSLLSAINSTSTRSTEASHPKLHSTTLPVGNLTVHSICNGLNLGQDELIVLDSEMRQLPELGRFSIIGIVLPNTKKIKYSVGAHYVCLQEGDKEELIHLDNHGGNIFSFVKAFMSEYQIMPDNDRAFCGGLMGYITYEACLETIGISASMRASRPDICFAFIEQSIVVDHSERVVHVQGLKIRDLCTETDQWLAQTVAVLKALSKKKQSSKPETRPPTILDRVVRRVLPEEREYRAKIAECQKEIGARNSYELCLTDQTLISLAGSTPSWDIYLNLRRLNPSPFGAYIRLGPLTLLSTSPERFMNWSRFQIRSAMPNDAEAELFSTCQFRPIKGTVRKEQRKPDGSTYRVAHGEATAKLTTQKEIAENLMIVDLIRHDLYSVCRDVWAEDLMAVEEYESVFQLVSVIEGKFFKPLHSSPRRPMVQTVRPKPRTNLK